MSVNGLVALFVVALVAFFLLAVAYVCNEGKK